MKILICSDGFHAHYFERTAWANAFNSVEGVRAILYDVNDRAFDVFDKYEPDVFIGQLYNLNDSTIKCIVERPHMKVALRAGEWNDGETDPHILCSTEKDIHFLNDLMSKTGKPDMIYSHYMQEDILSTHSKFVDMGLNVVGVPMSADINIYTQGRYNKYLDCDIGFVGGYWPYKGVVIDQYLTPLCKDFSYNIKIFGNQPWPHINQYCGMLKDNEVADLFCSAKICPNLSEPHSHTRGIDINERVFKILGAGGFCIMDNVAAARKIFQEGVVFAESPEAFRYKVDFYLAKKGDRLEIARLGKKTVLSGHTNFHRAATIMAGINELKTSERILKKYNDYLSSIQ